ncbi:hypothetical protein ABTK34_19330, partial [Acinetobacter baumannii]
MATDLPSLLQMLVDELPARAPVAVLPAIPSQGKVASASRRAAAPKPRLVTVPPVEPAGAVLDYEIADWTATANTRLTDALYEPY